MSWSFTFTNLSEIQTSIVNPLEGYYKGKIVSCDLDTERDGTINFVVEITEGDFAGAQVSKGIKLPSHANNGFIWKGLFESLGYKTADINSPAFTPDPKDWVGLPTSVYWRPGSKELGIWRELLFFGEQQWLAKKARFESEQSATEATKSVSAPSVPTAAAKSSIPTPPKAAPSVGAASGADLLNAIRRN
jgi:hypothetical protein